MRRAFGGVVLAAMLSACGSSLASPTTTVCTAMGGYSGVIVKGDPAAQVCLDGVCQATVPAAKGEVMARFDDVREQDKTHLVVVDGVRYEGPIAFKLSMPNGAGCPPRLYQAALVLRNGVLTVA